MNCYLRFNFIAIVFVSTKAYNSQRITVRSLKHKWQSIECATRKLKTFIGSELLNEREDKRTIKLVRNLNKAFYAAAHRNVKATFLLDQVAKIN